MIKRNEPDFKLTAVVKFSDVDDTESALVYANRFIIIHMSVDTLKVSPRLAKSCHRPVSKYELRIKIVPEGVHISLSNSKHASVWRSVNDVFKWPDILEWINANLYSIGEAVSNASVDDICADNAVKWIAESHVSLKKLIVFR